MLYEKKIIYKLTVFLIYIALSISTIYSYAEEDTNFIEKFSPKLEIEHVIEIAKEYAKNEDINLKDFFIEEIKYDWQKNEWYIFFQGVVPDPGNHFMLFIKDRTKETRLQPGK